MASRSSNRSYLRLASGLLFMTWLCSAARVEPAQNDRIKMEQVIKDLKYENAEGGPWRQGWEIKLSDYEDTKEKHTPKSEKLQVFVLPHSHNDPGWISTFEAYYDAKTKHILSAVTNTLSEKSSRHFIWAEISFFQRWWDDIDADMQAKFRKILNNGQFEFVTGGWVMNDEATPHYAATINQMTEGHEWLQETFKFKPKVSWSIDPFGYSPTQAYINQLNGLDGMLIQRAHYEIKKYLAQRQSLEFLWHQNFAEDASHDMFTHLMPFYSYDIPHTCGPVPAVCSQFDFTKTHTQWGGSVDDIHQGNVEHKSSILLGEYKKKSMLYRSKNVLAPLGDDFLYVSESDCNRMWRNHEKVQEHINNDPKMGSHVQFSNLSNYFEHVFGSSKKHSIGYPVLSGDFFTYADINDDYWSGYFTSRPFWKRFGREIEAVTRAADILYMLTKHTVEIPKDKDSAAFSRMQIARRWSAIFQHHDGMSGTAKPHVVDDYGVKLDEAKWNSKLVIREMIELLLAKSGQKSVELKTEERKQAPSKIVQKEVLDVGGSNPKTVVFFNPLSFERVEITSVRVSSDLVKITNGDSVIPSQVNPVFNSKGEPLEDQFELFWEISVQPFGLQTYFIEESTESHMPTIEMFDSKGSSSKSFRSTKILTKTFGDSAEISNEFLTVNLDPKSGLIASVKPKDDEQYELNEEFKEYNGRGGAYLMKVDKEPWAIGTNKKFILMKGNLVESSILIEQGPVNRRVINLYKSEKLSSSHIEVIIDADIRSESNRELFTNYQTNLNTNLEFFTDLNGFQLARRKTRTDRPIQHNFYPATTTVMHQDEKKRFSVLTQQPMGVGSMNSGELQIMLDRRLSQDDNRGLQEGVTDNLPLQYKFFLTFERNTQTKVSNPDLSRASNLKLLVLNHPLEAVFADSGAADWRAKMALSYAPLRSGFPEDLHFVSFRNRNLKGETLVQMTRLLNDGSFGEKNQQEPVSLDFFKIFADISVKSGAETTLSALHQKDKISAGKFLEISPKEIRGFVLRLLAGKTRGAFSGEDQKVLERSPNAAGSIAAAIKGKIEQDPPVLGVIGDDGAHNADDGADDGDDGGKGGKVIEDPEMNPPQFLNRDKENQAIIDQLKIDLKSETEKADLLKSKQNQVLEELKVVKKENEELKAKIADIMKRGEIGRGNSLLIFAMSIVIFGIIAYFGTKKRNMLPIFFGIFMVVNIMLPFLFFREAH